MLLFLGTKLKVYKSNAHAYFINYVLGHFRWQSYFSPAELADSEQTRDVIIFYQSWKFDDVSNSEYSYDCIKSQSQPLEPDNFLTPPFSRESLRGGGGGGLQFQGKWVSVSFGVYEYIYVHV